ncbi:unnamed protein product [Rotaria sordida]|uniref:Uncharacterized protein n=1 Tax=Rotaria sordida TaxID=392033 RepID=A0A814ZZ84_9BILA|nr:unnamed protein product [Rotaria sordida]CAF1248243.1 unnamed protein product [Rotaria sordida]
MMKELLSILSIAFLLILIVGTIPIDRQIEETPCENRMCLDDIAICICGSTMTPEDPCGCPFRCEACSFEWLPSFNWNFTGLVLPEIDLSNLVFDFSNWHWNIGKK